MKAIFENIIDSVLCGVKRKFIRQIWNMINGMRRFFVLVTLLIFSLMMMTLGFFGTMTYGIYNWSTKGELSFDALFNFMLGDFIFFFIILTLLLSKSTWLRTSGLAKHFESL